MTDNLEEVSLTPRLKPILPVKIVDTVEKLNELIAAVERTKDPIAIDAERASGFRYGQKAYLIQVAIKDDCIYLLDPTIAYPESDLQHLQQTLNSTTWIIHAASQDLPCLAEYGLKPINLFDTELAGRLLGLAKVSLASLTELYLKQSLAKEHSAVDWSTRPLPDSWIVYAALDVDVLFELWDAVANDLVAKNKMEIALAEFEQQKNFEVRNRGSERWRTTNGIHELKEAKSLTILKALWEAREQLAQEKDIAPGRLIPDASLIAVVKAQPKTRTELASIRDFTGRASRTYIDLWWKAFELGSQSSDLVELRPKATGIPNHRNWPSKFPDAHRRLLWSKKLLQQLSSDVQIPIENLVAPEVLKNICFSPPESSLEEVAASLKMKGVRDWQVNLVAPVLLAAFQKGDLPDKEITESTDPD
jgi:ribonuclease D